MRALAKLQFTNVANDDDDDDAIQIGMSERDKGWACHVSVARFISATTNAKSMESARPIIPRREC